MAVRIRLKRFGTKKKVHWRVVVADAKMPRDGRFIEEVGYYDPRQDPPRIQLKAERIKNWISKGAKPTETVQSLLKKFAQTSR
ncbi:MAG: 30S ribosomal protein S16 [Omnitrophica bacterium RIFCSPHIGHO2_02_FULL_46_11]|nr:MAG: 30S ribosomal protein S16 [Omnitrophica bacterium RIFCSPLOWO2_01_FULL_45_10b]OGW87865.1 MAG: 30S ribosomal protein S16 [Omnitrophica bacterium RIFCSPHIGHO2_02_FULL_46_11]